MQNRASSVQKGRVITRRVFMLAAAKLVLLGGITSRLYSLQISDREKYELLSDKNRIREWKTPPQRGFITDYFNNVLADNDRVFQVHLDLDQIRDFDDTMFKLKNIISLSNNEIRKIYDPELPVNIYELGLIYDIQVNGKKAEIKMTLTTPNCPVAESLPKEVKEGAMQVEEIDDVDLQLVWDPPWNKDMMSDAAKLELNL